MRIPTIVYGPAFISVCLCCVTTYQPGGTVEEESWASPAVPIPPDGVKMVEKVTQGEEDARTQIGRRGNLWVGSGRRSWWLESYKEVIPN